MDFDIESPLVTVYNIFRERNKRHCGGKIYKLAAHGILAGKDVVNTYSRRLPAARLTQSSQGKALVPVPEYPAAFSDFTLFLALQNK